MLRIPCLIQAFLALLLMGSLAQAQENQNPNQVPAQPEREWTFLVFLNGHNSLDQFGALNMHQMEKVGSTDRVNVVVQWASKQFETTKRMFVKKQDNPNPGDNFASTVVEEVPRIDMGDWKQLVEFVKWGVQKFPAKHYFVNVWNHGGGWHVNANLFSYGSPMQTYDISWDDYSHNVIKTEQLGEAMRQIAALIGHKVDIYGSDACLMSMAEVASEMAGTADAFIGSQEVEPGAGWPYDVLLKGWNEMPDASALNVAKHLAHSYVQSYSTPNPGTGRASNATMSVFDMSKLEAVHTAMKKLSAALGAQVDPEAIKKIMAAVSASQKFQYSDYVDVIDFTKNLQVNQEYQVMTEVTDVANAAAAFVSYNEATPAYKGANGLSVWIPASKSTLDRYIERYKGLNFDKVTNWSKVLVNLNP